MKPEDQRVALAKALGLPVCEHHPDKWEHRGTDGDSELYCIECKRYLSDMRVPKYLTDLNAVAEAEKVLLDDKPMDVQSMYLDYLYCVIGWDDANNAKDAKFKCYYGSVRATAAQRTEALLRTLGLWKE